MLPIAAAGGLGPVEPVQGLDRGVHVRGARMPVAGIGSHLQVDWVMVKPNENQGELKKKENDFTWPTSILCTPGPPPAMATVIPTGAPPEERCYKYFFKFVSIFVNICEKRSIFVNIGG